MVLVTKVLSILGSIFFVILTFAENYEAAGLFFIGSAIYYTLQESHE